MDFNQNTPLVFHLKNDEFDKVLKLSLLLGLFFIGFIPLTIWLIFPSEFLSQINWIDAWQKLLLKPIELAKIIFALLAVPVSIWMQSQHNKNARLMLNDSRMSYTSRMPLLSRWLDWQLDLEDIRSEKIKLRFSGNELGAQPVLLYRLSWGISGLRQIRPAAWILPNQTTLPVQKPSSFFGLVNWKKSENMALLQQQFDQLPLINALMQRGVLLPQVSKKREGIGLDLMA